jgi:hypothetical protein
MFSESRVSSPDHIVRLWKQMFRTVFYAYAMLQELSQDGGSMGWLLGWLVHSFIHAQPNEIIP